MFSGISFGVLVGFVSQAGVAGLGDSVGAYEQNRMMISGVVAHSFWFSRFMYRLPKRVGENRRQDKPFTIDVCVCFGENS